MPAVLKNKKVLMLIAGFAIIAAALLIFGGSASPSSSSSPAAPYLSVAPSADANADVALGGDLLAALALLRTIQLDTSVFANPIFKSLSDWGKKIAPQPAWRRNPFAPLGGGAPAKSSGNAAQTTPTPSAPTAPTTPPASAAQQPAVPPASASSPDVEVWDFSDIEFDL